MFKFCKRKVLLLMLLQVYIKYSIMFSPQTRGLRTEKELGSSTLKINKIQNSKEL